MAIDDKIKEGLRLGDIIVSASIVATAVLFGSLNFYYNNIYYEINGKKVYKKIDGVLDYTKLIVNENGSIELTKDHFMNYVHYKSNKDKNDDRKVYWIYKGANPFSRKDENLSFSRKDDFEKYPEVFQEADQELKKQLKRFSLEQ